MTKFKNQDIEFNTGVAFAKDRKGKPEGITSLTKALDILAECCGLSCCEGVIRLPARNTTEGTYEVYFDDDDLVVKHPNGTVTVLHADLDS